MSPSQSGLHRETETPADELRAAAKRIRDLAAAATPGPWLNLDNGDRIIRDPDATAAEDDSDPCGEGPPIEYVVDEPLSYPWNGDHIALFDPIVADATADLLEAEAGHMEDERAFFGPDGVAVCADQQWPRPQWNAATAAARAILGKERQRDA